MSYFAESLHSEPLETLIGTLDQKHIEESKDGRDPKNVAAIAGEEQRAVEPCSCCSRNDADAQADAVEDRQRHQEGPWQ